MQDISCIKGLIVRVGSELGAGRGVGASVEGVARVGAKDEGAGRVDGAIVEGCSERVLLKEGKGRVAVAMVKDEG